tara:strand:- start:16 stop:507 length:492 start_codon:yes stop_codon:yes gene_type:complete
MALVEELPARKMLWAYYKYSKFHANNTQTQYDPSFKDVFWNEPVEKYGVFLWCLALPFVPILMVINILLIPLWLAILVGGFLAITIPSIILGVIFDITRQIVVRKEGTYFLKWKYTDKVLWFWEMRPYGMSLQGYRDFKKDWLRNGHASKAATVIPESAVRFK